MLRSFYLIIVWVARPLDAKSERPWFPPSLHHEQVGRGQGLHFLELDALESAQVRVVHVQEQELALLAVLWQGVLILSHLLEDLVIERDPGQNPQDVIATLGGDHDDGLAAHELVFARNSSHRSDSHKKSPWCVGRT